MIRDTYAIIIFLLSLEALVLSVSSHPKFKKYFSFIPAVFWIYFLPMLASTCGMLDPKSPVYQSIASYLLPASLVLLLLSSDIRSIMRLEKQALIMMFAGALGIMLGTPLAFYLVKAHVGQEMWSGFGALSASWVGGSANMIAVKEAIGTPDRIFAPMVIVDTVVPYAWMGLLVGLVAFQPVYDRWNRADRAVLDSLAASAGEAKGHVSKGFDPLKVFAIACIGIFGTLAARYLAGCLPNVSNIISTYTWTIIIVSILGIALSFTPLKKLEGYGASKIGYFVLYFVLTSIGAKASISNIGATAFLIMAGFMIVIFHALVLLVTARIIRAPMFLAVVASQANIGGVASAPVVAAIYQPGLASVGLLLAILGNILGTYCGIITGQLCQWVAR
jgi:uncharacterized membrane protein